MGKNCGKQKKKEYETIKFMLCRNHVMMTAKSDKHSSMQLSRGSTCNCSLKYKDCKLDILHSKMTKSIVIKIT